MWLPKENEYARKSLRTGSETTAIEKGKAAYLEIYANLQQGKTYFSITTKEGVEKYLLFRMRDVELGHIVKGRHATIATHLQHFFSYIGKDTKLKELERTDCENYYYRRHKATNGNVKVHNGKELPFSYFEGYGGALGDGAHVGDAPLRPIGRVAKVCADNLRVARLGWGINRSQP